ncbi:MAG: coenzyme F420-0:L-glutamate ligase [Clostridia bacterium]|nr:coenzyme F420-0:L-glutamate ligase [Clostridia bacterium]
MNNVGVISMGIKTPIIREGDDLVKIVVDSVLKATYANTRYDTVDDKTTKAGWRTERVDTYSINDKDVIGITESVVARAAGNYVTVDEIADELRKYNQDAIAVLNPIYSRNRFSMILKAIAKAAGKAVYIYMPEFDEVGNPSGVNQFTGVNMMEYYRELVEAEGKECRIYDETSWNENKFKYCLTIYCGLHDYEQWKADYGDDTHITLADVCSDKCEYGLLGSNKANENTLKLFPSKKSAQELVEKVQAKIYEKTNKYVEVMVYGDGCFKDPVGGIWEWADPETSPAYTVGLNGTPNEIKIKAFADDQFAELTGKELDNAIKNTIKENNMNLVGNMASQGTTPRRYVDLLASLMDLTSGSGSKGTPVILVKNYFNTYAD